MAESSSPTVHAPVPQQHPERHQRDNVGLGVVFGILIGMVVFGAICFLFLYWLFGIFDASEKRSQPSITAVQQAPIQAPEPRLQGIQGFHPNTPPQDLAQMRKTNAQILSSYGPATEPGYARIPIDRAMDLMVEKGGLDAKH